MTDAALGFVGVTMFALLWDWIGVGRLAAYCSDFDYQYWPFSRRRQIGLLCLVLSAWTMWAMFGANGSLWLIILPIVLFGVWGAFAWQDVILQRRAHGSTPPRYSDSEYGS